VSFTTLGLNPTLLTHIARQGYTTPTPIQAAAIPPILAGNDVIGLAQTGTGKTAAFVLPILQRLQRGPAGGIRALIVTPTRELAEQILGTVRAFAAGGRIRSASVYGGVGFDAQERALRGGADLIVACPGRLLDHMSRGYVHCDTITTLVLDEADRLLDMGFAPAIRRIVAQLPAARQTLLFSATMGPDVADLVQAATRNPQTIRLSSDRPAETIAHAIVPVAEEQKMMALLELLRRERAGAVLVFTRTKHRADRVAQRLEREGARVARLHSNRSQRQRQLALDGFRDGTFDVLVATDIAARGIDVSTVSQVINFDMPDTSDAYIHRIGRTGRAERSGDALTLATPADRAMVRVIERALGAPLPRHSLPGLPLVDDAAMPPPPPAPARPALPRDHRGDAPYGRPPAHHAYRTNAPPHAAAVAPRTRDRTAPPVDARHAAPPPTAPRRRSPR
jgi:ATP-dependent RNA helicase RhlE